MRQWDEDIYPMGTLIREICYDGFTVVWKIDALANNGVYTLIPHEVPFLEHVNNWQCGYRKMNALLRKGNEKGNTFTIINNDHFEEDLFTL